MQTKLPKSRFYQKTQLDRMRISKDIDDLNKYANYCIEQQRLVANRENPTSPENIKEFKEWGYKYSETIRKIDDIIYEKSDCQKPCREEYTIPHIQNMK